MEEKFSIKEKLMEEKTIVPKCNWTCLYTYRCVLSYFVWTLLLLCAEWVELGWVCYERWVRKWKRKTTTSIFFIAMLISCFCEWVFGRDCGWGTSMALSCPNHVYKCMLVSHRMRFFFLLKVMRIEQINKMMNPQKFEKIMTW